MRFERKYQITHLSKSTVEQAIRLHPAGFREIFPMRQVNNIYFDTSDFQTFRHNVDGVNQRKKYRLRWYGTDLNAINNPRFEIKIKHNELGTKEITQIANFELTQLARITKQVNNLNPLLSLYPTLLNTYHRSYFGTPNGKFRITVDWNLHFYAPLHQAAFSQQAYQQKAVILELKYEEEDDELARDIFRYLPFRQTKNSKYVTGVLAGQKT